MPIQTVLGPIHPAALGQTLMHEHTFFDIEVSPGAYDAIVDDEAILADELRAYAAAGGSGLVDLTPPALGRNPAGMARLAAATGLNVVMGAGWYRGEYHPDDVRTHSANELADALVREFRDGVGDTGIRPGILGELGTGRHAIRATEERTFRAAARAQREVGFSISTHTTHYGELALEQIALLRAEGVPVDRIVIGHVGERRGATDVLAIAETGVFVQIDHVGRRLEAGMISDEQRALNVAELVRAGRVGQVTLSMDICSNSQMHAHGGHGFDLLLRTFVPLLREQGIGEADIATMLVENPRRILAFG
jgi:phosphotriesterase-related protein